MYSAQTWTRWALIPLWTVHIVILVPLITLLAFVLLQESANYKALGVQIAAITLAGVALVLEPIEMVFDSAKLLDPLVYLSFQIYRAIFATVFLPLEGVQYSDNENPDWFHIVLLITLIFFVLMAISFYSSLAYGIVVFLRGWKRNIYSDIEKEPEDGPDGSSSRGDSGSWTPISVSGSGKKSARQSTRSTSS